jgi:hypothetical protein
VIHEIEPSSPAAMRRIVDTFTRELQALLADPLAPDRARRIFLYRHTISRYSTWLEWHQPEERHVLH